jgi:hypothetical protein
MKLVNLILFRQNGENEVYDHNVPMDIAKDFCSSPSSHGRGWFIGWTEANTVDEFIDGEYNPSYVPQLGFELLRFENRTINYYGSFYYGDKVGEKQLADLRRKTNAFNRSQKKYMKHSMEIGKRPVKDRTCKKVGIKKRKDRYDVYQYNYRLNIQQDEDGKYVFNEG